MVWAVCYWVGPANQCDLGNTVQAACRALLTGTCIQTASVAKIRQLSIQLVAAAVNQLQMCLNFCLISRSLYWSSDIKTDWNTLVSMWQTAQNRSPWRIFFSAFLYPNEKDVGAHTGSWNEERNEEIWKRGHRPVPGIFCSYLLYYRVDSSVPGHMVWINKAVHECMLTVQYREMQMCIDSPLT